MSLAPDTPPPPQRDVRECPDCGLLCRLPPRRPGFAADCPRCDAVLWRMRRAPARFAYACAQAAGLLYIFALTAPFLELTTYGHFALARLATGPVQLAAQGFRGLAGLVFLVTLVAPGLKIGLLLLLVGGLHRLPTSVLRHALRLYTLLSPWAMLDVYMLGILVAYTRLSSLADVHIDTALYALTGCMLSLAAADAALDTETLWQSLGGPPPQPVRKPDSLNRTWALLLSAGLLYIPANLYPFMDVTRLSQTTNYTIMGGVFELADAGEWPLALLVFGASITIPLTKVLALAYMLVATHCGWAEHLRSRTIGYRVIDFIGRWSMIDVFMVSILVGLLRFGTFTSVRADTGAVCFGTVVVLTIFAVNAFDPRLMWDAVPATLTDVKDSA